MDEGKVRIHIGYVYVSLGRSPAEYSLRRRKALAQGKVEQSDFVCPRVQFNFLSLVGGYGRIVAVGFSIVVHPVLFVGHLLIAEVLTGNKSGIKL